MSEGPFRGAFPHQHGDPRSLMERIHAQLRERIEEAVEMAALRLMVELRQRAGRAAPETSRSSDRLEFQAITQELTLHLRQAFFAELPAELRTPLVEAEAAGSEPAAGVLSGQVFLARRLPDYWQRFERHQMAYAERRLAAARGPAWLRRLFDGS